LFIRLWSASPELDDSVISREERNKIHKHIKTIQQHLETTMTRVMKMPLPREGVGEVPVNVTAIGAQSVLQPQLH